MSPDATLPADVAGAAVPVAAPQTGDPEVDAVLGRMRAELAELAEVDNADPAARREVLDRAHRALRVLLDEPAPQGAGEPDPAPGMTDPAPGTTVLPEGAAGRAPSVIVPPAQGIVQAAGATVQAAGATVQGRPPGDGVGNVRE